MKTSWMTLCGVCLIWTGCAEDESDKKTASEPVGEFQSSLEAEDKTGDLDDAEVEDFCEEAADFAAKLSEDELQRGLCASAAMLFAALAEGDSPASDCQMTYDICVDAGAEAFSGAETSSMCLLEQVPDACELTVAQVEACITAQTELFQDLANDFSCNDIDWDDLEGLAPEACVEVETCTP